MISLVYSLVLCLTVLLSPLHLTEKQPMLNIVGTKWISPISDNCFESLCFETGRTVMYYRCDHDTYVELGFRMEGNRIEIDAFSDDSLSIDNKLVLYEDNSVLKQGPKRNDRFPANFILVPGGMCN
jgi:hypothetical protein